MEELRTEGFAVVKFLSSPHKNIRDAMVEMILNNGINHHEDLKEVLICYLRLNTNEYHDMNINLFQRCTLI
ncbi:hypothetical protein Bca52824_017466 [Brassica carinata]|uniref:Transcription repressor n=1 Tax=Brassica carinata TaxID=52824 RepID=A0A8X7NZK4_BRACI|nr:hypothetical protein Bca52824_095079 [Brassica carinata]KAG2314344.1 hypothetical protein Bca52824_017466 [Brassica carinata]